MEVNWADIGWTLAWCAVLALLTALAVYLVGRFRGHAGDEQPQASELLTNFRESHSRGELSDGEFRTIKTLLKGQLEDELKRASDTGKDDCSKLDASADMDGPWQS
jgi:hypothetical protein